MKAYDLTENDIPLLDRLVLIKELTSTESHVIRNHKWVKIKSSRTYQYSQFRSRTGDFAYNWIDVENVRCSWEEDVRKAKELQ